MQGNENKRDTPRRLGIQGNAKRRRGATGAERPPPKVVTEIGATLGTTHTEQKRTPCRQLASRTTSDDLVDQTVGQLLGEPRRKFLCESRHRNSSLAATCKLNMASTCALADTMPTAPTLGKALQILLVQKAAKKLGPLTPRPSKKALIDFDQAHAA